MGGKVSRCHSVVYSLWNDVLLFMNKIAVENTDRLSMLEIQIHMHKRKQVSVSLSKSCFHLISSITILENHMKPQTIFTFLLFIIISFHSTWSRAQEVEDEREFDYRKGSEKGPQHWGDLKKEWATCKHGKSQSPIDLSTRGVRLVPKFGLLSNTYHPQNATLKNRGHDVQVKWEGDAGSICINGVDYFLHQAHFHSPSEHTINGRRYDLELHMVHSSNSNPEKVVVVGVLYKIGRPDPFLSKMEKYIRKMVDEVEEEEIGEIHPLEISKRGRNYYRYVGSLTVPPCTEGVLWIISHKVRTVSREQAKLLREAVHDYAESNARPLQPRNEREMEFHVPVKKPRY